MITSLANPKVKLVRSLSRRRARYAAQQFVVEGVRLIEEVVGAGIVPALVLYSARADEEPRAHLLLERLRAVTSEILAASDQVMQAASSTEAPQGIVAVVPFVALPLPAPLQVTLILDAVRDPGNVGAMLRSGRAAGVSAIFFAPGTADPYNEKVVRAAMGTHFRVPLRVMRWEDIEDALHGVRRIYIADAGGEVEYTRADWAPPFAIIVGGEAEGASEDAKKIATARVRIPMRGGAESLNAAMAATVLLFEAAKKTKWAT